MKNINKIVVVALLILGFNSNAQDSNNPWAFSFGVNAVDSRTDAGGGRDWLNRHFSQPFAVKDNWNILPSISYIGLNKYIGDNFSFGVSGTVNKIEKFVNYTPANGYVVSNPGDLMYYGIDATVKYSFQSLIKSKVIDPSLSVGGGYTFLGDASFGTINTGAGLTFWVTETVGLELTTKYKKSFQDRVTAGVPNAPSFFQHTLGIVFKFGGTDTDKDGIYDKEDACPEVAGLKQFNGCPDTDGDGIIDGSDSCPEVAGLAEFQGCPDADGDGVADKADNCPSVKGAKENAGCPWPDTDGDSVLDKDDKCPTVAGTVANNGCPEVTEEAMKKLNEYGKTILFNSGKASFQKQALPILQAMAAILKEYPTAIFSLEGHTDNTGSDALNQKLSEERAAAVKNFLIENGIDASRLSSKGFGESMPVESNKTAKGKANNRRVEVKLVK